MQALTQVLLEEIFAHEAFRWGMGFAVGLYIAMRLIGFYWKKYKAGKKKKP